jgi:ubiquinone/menaquinone biosynthesis C-methylase UbiE
MIGTLGEIPDKVTALRELRRVLKQRGRVFIARGLSLSINWPKVLLLLRYSALRRSSNSDRLFLVLRRIAVGNLIRFALQKPEEVSAHSGF